MSVVHFCFACLLFGSGRLTLTILNCWRCIVCEKGLDRVAEGLNVLVIFSLLFHFGVESDNIGIKLNPPLVLVEVFPKEQ